MKVNDVMSKDVKVIEKDTTVQKAATIMRNKNIGSLPVSEGDKLIGIVTDRDLAIKVLAEGKSADTSVGEYVGGRIKYCYEDESVEDVSSKMSEFKIRRMPVMNRDKKLVGIISLGDLATDQRSQKEASEAHSRIAQ